LYRKRRCSAARTAKFGPKGRRPPANSGTASSPKSRPPKTEFRSNASLSENHFGTGGAYLGVMGPPNTAACGQRLNASA
jgi:hypothetical protein